MLTLYHAPHSTCSQKVRMVLHEKGVPFDEVRIDLGKKEQLKPEYLAINPNGVVPTLVDDGTPIVESSVICEYLDEKYPQNSLVPSDLIERARMRAWTHYIEEVAVGAIRVPSFNRAFLYRFEGQDQQQFEKNEIGPRPVRRELFQRMGSPKGFSKEEIDRSLEQLTETCRRMDAAVAKQGTVADGRAVHPRRCAGDAEHRPYGGPWAIERLGEQISGRQRLVQPSTGATGIQGDLFPGDPRVGFSAVTVALCGRSGLKFRRYHMDIRDPNQQPPFGRLHGHENHALVEGQG